MRQIVDRTMRLIAIAFRSIMRRKLYHSIAGHDSSPIVSSAMTVAGSRCGGLIFIFELISRKYEFSISR